MRTTDTLSKDAKRIEKATRRFLDDLSDTIHDGADSARQSATNLLRDKAERVANTTHELSERVANKARQTGKAIRHEKDELAGRISEHPFSSTLTATMAGAALGALLAMGISRMFSNDD